MAEYLENSVQNVALNQPAIFTASIPCPKGNVIHEDGTGIFILRGNTSNCFARYKVTYGGNIALPEGGTPGQIAVALTVNGEVRPTSRAIVTPAAVEEYFSVSRSAEITVPRGCCFTVSLRHVQATDDPTVTPAPVITLQNASLTVTRTA